MSKITIYIAIFMYYKDFVNEFMIIKIFNINSLENVINLLKIDGFSLLMEIHIHIYVKSY